MLIFLLELIQLLKNRLLRVIDSWNIDANSEDIIESETAGHRVWKKRKSCNIMIIQIILFIWM